MHVDKLKLCKGDKPKTWRSEGEADVAELEDVEEEAATNSATGEHSLGPRDDKSEADRPHVGCVTCRQFMKRSSNEVQPFSKTWKRIAN